MFIKNRIAPVSHSMEFTCCVYETESVIGSTTIGIKLDRDLDASEEN